MAKLLKFISGITNEAQGVVTQVIAGVCISSPPATATYISEAARAASLPGEIFPAAQFLEQFRLVPDFSQRYIASITPTQWHKRTGPDLTISLYIAHTVASDTALK